MIVQIGAANYLGTRDNLDIIIMKADVKIDAAENEIICKIITRSLKYGILNYNLSI